MQVRSCTDCETISAIAYQLYYPGLHWFALSVACAPLRAARLTASILLSGKMGSVQPVRARDGDKTEVAIRAREGER